MRNSNHRNIPPESMSESSDGLSDSDTGNDENSEEDLVMKTTYSWSLQLPTSAGGR